MAWPSTDSGSLKSSRSKRSTTNLANLRLAPLSSKFDEPSGRQSTSTKSPYEETRDFARHHSSYLQGRSAPTTPGILSRSSSRRHLAGGLSRRGSLYENEVVTYAYAMTVQGGEERPEVGSGQVPKAKSEAALGLSQSSASSSASGILKKRQQHGSTPGDMAPPRVKSRTKPADSDWWTRTGAATSAMLQESKGQSWLSSRPSSVSVAAMAETMDDDGDDDDDEGYEEMAALSYMGQRPKSTTGVLSPVDTRTSKWGSRYGSRATSRRTSRRGSVVDLRTPLAMSSGPGAMTSYFDAHATSAESASAIDEELEKESADERELTRLASARPQDGLTGLMDKIMNFSLFIASEDQAETSSDYDLAPPHETEDEAKARIAAIAKRKREAKERLVALPRPIDEADGAEQNDVGWRDAAWLFSVATRAMFSESNAV